MIEKKLLSTHAVIMLVIAIVKMATVGMLTANAQSTMATLKGVVTDEKGSVVIGAAITVINHDTALRRQATTNNEGYFTVSLLPAGNYTVAAQQSGFSPVEIRGVILNANDQRALQIQLKVSQIGASVEIVSGVVPLESSPAVSTLIDRQFVENLPLNGRSLQPLIALTPGVTLTSYQGQFSVNGQRATANYFTVDGVSANIGSSNSPYVDKGGAGALAGFNTLGGTSNLVSVDALQEIQIQTSTYAPEFGRMPGAQISMTTRSGTNQLRGTVFNYLRNEILDANDWFANSQNLPKAPMRQNNFGGVLGGPIVLPHLYHGRDRSFFFFSYEGLRLRQPQTIVAEVPSMASRQRAPEKIRPVLEAFPIPTGRETGGGKAEFVGSSSNPSVTDSISIRLDHTVNKKLTFFGRYNYAPSETTTRFPSNYYSPSVLNPVVSNTETITAGATWIITQNLSNEFRANWSENRGAYYYDLDNFGGAVPFQDSLVFPSYASRRDSEFRFLMTSGGYILLGRDGDNFQRQVNLVDNLSFNTGGHAFKFGVDYRRLTPVIDSRRYLLQFSFADIGSAIAGRASSVRIDTSSGPRYPLFTNFSAYAQDTWRITPRVTFTYGLRWEVNPPPTERKGRDALAVDQVDNPNTIKLRPQGTPLWQTTYNNFSPRVGVAYQLSQIKGWETVLRGGAGMFYDIGSSQAGSAWGPYTPFSSFKRWNAVTYPLDPPSLYDPAPFNLDPPYTIYAFDPHLKLPITYQWNFAIEQSINSNQTLSISYVGAAGRRLLLTDYLNNPNPNFTYIYLIRNAATSDYHALQAEFQRRLSRRLQALVAYTWAHSIDISSDEGSNGIRSDKMDPALNRGSSDYDIRHTLNAAVTYDLPTSSIGRVVDSILGRWSVDVLFKAHSGAPINVYSSRELTDIGVQSARPDLVLGVPLWIDAPTVAGGKRLNRGAFSIPVGRQGSLGRNALRGFGAWQLDLALRRQFNFTERFNLQLRAEAFNIFNHPNFGIPDTTLTSAYFGRSTKMLGRSLGGLNALYQVGGPRSLQMALKLQF